MSVEWQVSDDVMAQLLAGAGAALCDVLDGKSLAALAVSQHFREALGNAVGRNVDLFVEGGKIGVWSSEEEDGSWRVFFCNPDMDGNGQTEFETDLRDVLLDAPLDDARLPFAAWLRAVADEVEAAAKRWGNGG